MGDVSRELRKAQEALKEAETLAGEGLWDGAASRLYYAAYHAARAAVWKGNPEARMRTHRGVMTQFGREVVLKGRAPKESGALLSELGDYRERADYGAGRVSPEVVRRGLERVRRMVGLVKRL